MTIAAMALSVALGQSSLVDFAGGYGITEGTQGAYFPMPSRAVADGPAFSVEWSADGRYLAMIRLKTEDQALRGPASEALVSMQSVGFAVTVWDAFTGESTDVLDMPMDGGFVELMPSADPSVMFVVAETSNFAERVVVRRLDLEAKRVEEIVVPTDPFTIFDVEASPVQPILLVRRTGFPTGNAQFDLPQEHLGVFLDVVSLDGRVLSTTRVAEAGE